MSSIRTVRAKFSVNTIIQNGTTSTVHLNAVYSSRNGKRAEENKAFSDATPYGAIQVGIQNDKPALEFFEPGKEVYVDFAEVPAD